MPVVAHELGHVLDLDDLAEPDAADPARNVLNLMMNRPQDPNTGQAFRRQNRLQSSVVTETGAFQDQIELSRNKASRLAP
jgi:hypothetical protein